MQVTPPDSATVQFEYRSPGLEITRDPSGLMTISYIDALGRDVVTDLRDMDGLLIVRKQEKKKG